MDAGGFTRDVTDVGRVCKEEWGGVLIVGWMSALSR